MNSKLARTIKRNKYRFLIAIILWVIITIVFVAPMAISIADATETGEFKLNIFIESFGTNIVRPFNSIGTCFDVKYIGTFGNTLLGFSIVYFLILVIGFIRSVPKHQYEDIEHGSSDWSENGEQYKILSSKKGIIVAEKNYLPIDKRGNTNVLVVGRFWFW